ncbi:unnamed protein product [Adineta ricciae]|uniref:PKD/REJ-like domain-containing protein n=1 Tax=Adineta ricciae TaxID=249248 RepID=A0A815G596_ADIRI|nr:unnamed protein product [Adineta ricciae]
MAIEEISGCVNNRYFIRIFNVDDYSYAFVNQHYVARQSLRTDSGFIDVTAYIHDGISNFTFLAYNVFNPYSWGFQIMNNNSTIFADTAGIAGSVSASRRLRPNQFVYNRMISVNTAKYSIVSTTPTTSCTGKNDKYSIRLYNIDDTSYGYVNQQLIISQSYTDSGFVDVTPYVQNDSNKFTFLTYNIAATYNWGFQIMENNDIIFDDIGGLVPIYGADSGNTSRSNQFVYNKTIFINVTKCENMTSASSTNCFVPKIILIPATSTLSSPIQFQRSQDFFISSYIQLMCNISLATIMKWTINNCIQTNCSSQIQIAPSINTTFNELYIPARTLPYGTYEFILNVTIAASSALTSSASAFVAIVSSNIAANLVQFGTSMITSGHQQNLTLDPGSYSVDPNELIFNRSKWTYDYYCRVYGVQSFPSMNGSLLTIDDPMNPSCTSNQSEHDI